MSNLSSQQAVQEGQYNYPYHYIPEFSNEVFSQTRHWSWGYRYLGGIKVVFDQIKSNLTKSLIDIGCGDGRFIREVAEKHPDLKCAGVDYSGRAIKLAQMMNPELDFQCIDITKENHLEKYDMATSIEVLEHIPPENLDLFVESIGLILSDKGVFILTVPHINKGLKSNKHYQHFYGDQLVKILEPYFMDFRVIPFDPASRILTIMQKLIGGLGENFIITNKKILTGFYNLYISKYLYASDEKRCGRIAVVCRKR